MRKGFTPEVVVKIAVIACLLFMAGAEWVSAEGKECGLNVSALESRIPPTDSRFEKHSPGRVYTGPELYDYMNGGAVEYLDAGCRCMWVKEFEAAGGPLMVVEVYEFADPAGAGRVYADNKGDQPVGIGQQGSLSEHGYLIFRQETVLCRILSYNKADPESMIELAEAAEKALADPAAAGSEDIKTRGGQKPEMTGRNSDSIVILGASYAKGWEVQTINGMNVVNKGVGGEQSGEMRARFETDVAAENPEYVIIWGFINDIFRTEKDRIDKTLKQIRQNIEEMTALSRKHGITPILATEVTIRPKDGWKEKAASLVGKLLGKQSYQAYVNDKVMAVNDWIRQFARETGIMLLDFEKVLANDDGMRKKEYAVSDGSHISEAGYRRLSESAREAMKTLSGSSGG